MVIITVIHLATCKLKFGNNFRTTLLWVSFSGRTNNCEELMHDFEPFVLPALQNSEILPVPRNISASLQIAAQRIFAGNNFISGENPPGGGENNVAPLK